MMPYIGIIVFLLTIHCGFQQEKERWQEIDRQVEREKSYDKPIIIKDDRKIDCKWDGYIQHLKETENK